MTKYVGPADFELTLYRSHGIENQASSARYPSFIGRTGIDFLIFLQTHKLEARDIYDTYQKRLIFLFSLNPFSGSFFARGQKLFVSTPNLELTPLSHVAITHVIHGVRTADPPYVFKLTRTSVVHGILVSYLLSLAHLPKQAPI